MFKYRTVFLSLFAVILFLNVNIPIIALSKAITDTTEIKEAGTYDVEIWDETKTKKVTIKVTVLYPRTVRSVEYNEAIDAYDIKIALNSFSKLSNEDLIRLTNARAWSTVDNEAVEVRVKERIEKDKTNGWYQIVFATEYGTQTTVNILEVEDLVVAEMNEITMPFYLNFIEFLSFYKFALLMFLLLLIPLILLIFLFIYIRKRVNEMKELLDN